MLIIGAGGHAKEILDVLSDDNGEKVYFYDDITLDQPNYFYRQFDILKTEKEVIYYFENVSKRFFLGIGGPKIRMRLANKFSLLGGELSSVISKRSYISRFDVSLGSGVNIMHNVTIQPSVKIGSGSLINTNSIIHHDSTMGNFCELCPTAVVTGRCNVGDFCFIGTGAIIMPGLTIGTDVIVGAGAVVTENIPENTTVAGIPARPIRK